MFAKVVLMPKKIPLLLTASRIPRKETLPLGKRNKEKFLEHENTVLRRSR